MGLLVPTNSKQAGNRKSETEQVFVWTEKKQPWDDWKGKEKAERKLFGAISRRLGS